LFYYSASEAALGLCSAFLARWNLAFLQHAGLSALQAPLLAAQAAAFAAQQVAGLSAQAGFCLLLPLSPANRLHAKALNATHMISFFIVFISVHWLSGQNLKYRDRSVKSAFDVR
jgi:hypothetical protein